MTTQNARAHVGGKPGGADPRRWIALAVMLTAMAMELLDVLIVNLALPEIGADLGASAAALAWIVASYPLSFGVLLVLGGRLGDAFGRKRMFLLGVAGFTAASVLSGAAPDQVLLLAGRTLQGAFAAIMTPQILSVIQIAFAPAERARAYASFGAVQGISTVGGPVIGGLLIEADLFGLGWRPIFLINLPIGLAAVAAAALVMRESRAPETQRFDVLGAFLLALPLFLLLYPLIQGGEHGWRAAHVVMLVAVPPSLLLFLAYQNRRDRSGGMPLVPPRLFRQRAFTGGILTGLTFFTGVTGFMMVYAITMQQGLGFSARAAGLILIPYSVGVGIAAGASGVLMSRLGRRLIALGALVKGAGMGVLVITYGAAGDGLAWWHPLPGLLICGLGMGLVAPTVADVALGRVRSVDAGAASGGLITAGQVGGALGVALISAVFFGLLGAGAPGDASAYGRAFTGALFFEIGVMLLTMLLTLILPATIRAPDKSASP